MAAPVHTLLKGITTKNSEVIIGSQFFFFDIVQKTVGFSAFFQRLFAVVLKTAVPFCLI